MPEANKANGKGAAHDPNGIMERPRFNPNRAA